MPRAKNKINKNLPATILTLATKMEPLIPTRTAAITTTELTESRNLSTHSEGNAVQQASQRKKTTMEPMQQIDGDRGREGRQVRLKFVIRMQKKSN